MNLGSIVHFVLNTGPNRGAHRPAVVVGVSGSFVDLQVFASGTKSRGDALPNVFWVEHAQLDQENKLFGTWHEAETDEWETANSNHERNECLR